MGEIVNFLIIINSSKWKRTLSDARESEEHPFKEVSLLTSNTGMVGIAK